MIRIGGKEISGTRHDGKPRAPADALLSGTGWFVRAGETGPVLHFIGGEQGGREMSVPLSEADFAGLEAGEIDIQTLMARGYER